MKPIPLTLLFVVLFASVVCQAADKASSNAPPVSAASKSKDSSLLTEEQIAALKTVEVVNEKTGVTILFDAVAEAKTTFSDNAKDNEKARTKYTKRGKIPFRIGVHFYMDKPNEKKSQKGTVHYVIMNQAGTVVQKGSKKADEMRMPDDKNEGGWIGELEAPGDYTVLVWVDRARKGMLGVKLSMTLAAL
jgi:hypothetical protein